MISSGYVIFHTYSGMGLYEDARYKCKWFSPLDKLVVMEPDYQNDIWDQLVVGGTIVV